MCVVGVFWLGVVLRGDRRIITYVEGDLNLVGIIINDLSTLSDPNSQASRVRIVCFA